MTTTGNCFRCHEPGHWISDCPLKINSDQPPPSIHCPCGGGLCQTKVANTQRNPGRKFHKCPAAQSCTFFKWCDEVTDKHIEFRPAFTIPICLCGSGPCRRFIADSGPDSGRAYYLCCIKKGFGACGFFMWEGDEMPQICDAVVDEDEMSFCLEAEISSCCGSLGIPLIGPSVIESDETLRVDQGTCSAPSKLSFKERNSDEAMSDDLGSSSGSVVTNNEQPGTVEAEWSSPNLQEIIEQYNSEKQRLESVSGKHVQVLSEFMGSYRRLRLLHEKTSDLRKLLLETEKEMACCEAETLELGASCREVASEMAESQKRMQETAEKLGKGLEVLKQKEFVTMKRRKC